MAPQKNDEISNFNSKTGILPFLHLLQELKVKFIFKVGVSTFCRLRKGLDG